VRNRLFPPTCLWLLESASWNSHPAGSRLPLLSAASTGLVALMATNAPFARLGDRHPFRTWLPRSFCWAPAGRAAPPGRRPMGSTSGTLPVGLRRWRSAAPELVLPVSRYTRDQPARTSSAGAGPRNGRVLPNTSRRTLPPGPRPVGPAGALQPEAGANRLHFLDHRASPARIVIQHIDALIHRECQSCASLWPDLVLLIGGRTATTPAAGCAARFSSWLAKRVCCLPLCRRRAGRCLTGSHSLFALAERGGKGFGIVFLRGARLRQARAGRQPRWLSDPLS